jgi:16S rRNA (guanine966-N2)-methyltransferase
LHIIAGELKGRTLFSGRGRAVRPTLGHVREALFSILGDRVPGVSVLDLFAGSGALSFEAISRGAAHAVQLERDAQAFRVLQRNVEALGLESRVTAVRADARVWLRQNPVSSYEILFMDPPYAGPEGPAVLAALTGGMELHPDALLTWEFDARSATAPEIAGFEQAVCRRYGDTGLVIYRRAPG